MTKLSKFKLKGVKSTNFAYGRAQKVKPANSRVQKYRATYGRVQKVKPANSKAVDGTLSYYYKVQSQKYSIDRFDLLHPAICSSVLLHP